MKRLPLLIIALLSFSIYNYGQSNVDTLTYSTESKKESDFKTEGKYKYFDRNFIEEKSMFRLGTNLRSIVGTSFLLEYERKIKRSSSLSLGLLFSEGQGNRHPHEGTGITAAYKYFYSTRKRIDTDKGGDNLNGSFISFQYNHNITNWNKKITYNATNFKLLWGLQKRLGRFGHIELTTGLSYTPDRLTRKFIIENDKSLSSKIVNDRISIVRNIKLSFAIGSLVKNNTYSTPYMLNVKNELNRLTNQLKEDKSFFKVGLTRIKFGEADFLFSGTLAFERKLVPSLSLIIENDFRLEKRPENSFYDEYGINAGLRYYYSINRRIDKEVSVNNFSANYISLMLLDLYGYNTQNEQIRGRYEETRIALLGGIQRRVGIGYIDFMIGPSYGALVGPARNEKRGFSFESRVNFGIGW